MTAEAKAGVMCPPARDGQGLPATPAGQSPPWSQWREPAPRTSVSTSSSRPREQICGAPLEAASCGVWFWRPQDANAPVPLGVRKELAEL